MMADEALTDEQLAEIRGRVENQVATQVEAEYLLAELDRMRSLTAAQFLREKANRTLAHDQYQRTLILRQLDALEQVHRNQQE